MHINDIKPDHNIFDDVEMVIEETSPIVGRVVGVKPDPCDSNLWYYQIEFYQNGTWIHQDKLRRHFKKADNPPPVGPEKKE